VNRAAEAIDPVADAGALAKVLFSGLVNLLSAEVAFPNETKVFLGRIIERRE
jgi:hypothetical protein